MTASGVLGRIGYQQFNYHYNFLPRYGLFYIEVSKAACTTIKSFLSDAMLQGSGYGSANLEALRRKPHVPFLHSPFVKPYQIGYDRFVDMMNSDEFITITVVRDPTTRFVSAFRDKILRKRKQAEKLIPYLKANGLMDGDDIPTLTTIQFANYLASLERPKEFDQHWRPQYPHISPDIVRYDRIIRLEDLDADLGEILAKVGLEWDSRQVGGHFTHSTAESIDESDLPGEVRDILRTVYGRDYSEFGYAMP